MKFKVGDIVKSKWQTYKIVGTHNLQYSMQLIVDGTLSYTYSVYSKEIDNGDYELEDYSFDKHLKEILDE